LDLKFDPPFIRKDVIFIKKLLLLFLIILFSISTQAAPLEGIFTCGLEGETTSPHLYTPSDF